jgi:hypothetical protein
MTPEQREFNRRWIERLRSGGDRQGRGMLRGLDGCKCCLGVAAVMADVPSVIVMDRFRFSFNRGAYQSRVLPSVLWFTFTTGLSYDFMHRLANENDDGKTFKEIAAIIETEVNRL